MKEDVDWRGELVADVSISSWKRKGLGSPLDPAWKVTDSEPSPPAPQTWGGILSDAANGRRYDGLWCCDGGEKSRRPATPAGRCCGFGPNRTAVRRGAL